MKSGIYGPRFSRTEGHVTGPYRALKPFSLTEIGIDEAKFGKVLAPTFDDLSLDQYEHKRQQVEYLKKLFPAHRARLTNFLSDYFADISTIEIELTDLHQTLHSDQLRKLDTIGEVRYRTAAKFEVSLLSDLETVKVRRIECGQFRQKCYTSHDFRVLPRSFTETSDKVVDNADFNRLIWFVCSQVRANAPMAVNFSMILHQVSVVVQEGHPFVLPDGVHKDGADYIVSAIPIIMENVQPPLSTVYDTNKHKIFETHLAVGQGLFHDDTIYWHSLSPLTATAAQGRRCTLGFDVQIEDPK